MEQSKKDIKEGKISSSDFNNFEKKSIKFFKKHRDLVPKLKGNLSDFYASSLTYHYRIILTIEIRNKEIVLVNIGTHDDVY